MSDEKFLGTPLLSIGEEDIKENPEKEECNRSDNKMRFLSTPYGNKHMRKETTNEDFNSEELKISSSSINSTNNDITNSNTNNNDIVSEKGIVHEKLGKELLKKELFFNDICSVSSDKVSKGNEYLNEEEKKRRTLGGIDSMQAYNGLHPHSSAVSGSRNIIPSNDVKNKDYKVRIKCFNKYLKYNVHKISNGENFLYSLQTNELLKMVHQIKGASNSGVKYKSGLAQYRDIRQLVSNNTNTRFDISPKRNCVMLNLPYRKCIIFKDFLYYIPTYTNNPTREIARKEEKMCEYFIEHAKAVSLIKGSLPFEILILEAIFVDVCDELKKEIDPVVGEAEKLFEVISSNLSVYKRMNKLTEMRRKLNIIEEKVQSVYKSIQAVLNNDADVKRLEVSYFWDKPQLWDDCGPTPNNEDTEMLLEYYCHEIEEFLKMIRRTDESLDDLLQMVELNLDDARNNVLKLELGLKIYGIIISVVGTIAAIFGMNIKNGFENDQLVFWAFAFLLALICFFCLFYVYISFKKVSI